LQGLPVYEQFTKELDSMRFQTSILFLQWTAQASDDGSSSDRENLQQLEGQFIAKIFPYKTLESFSMPYFERCVQLTQTGKNLSGLEFVNFRHSALILATTSGNIDDMDKSSERMGNSRDLPLEKESHGKFGRC
jgi:hypothetical protein